MLDKGKSDRIDSPTLFNAHCNMIGGHFMAKFVPATTDNTNVGSTPNHRDILNQEYEALFNENGILEKVRSLLLRGWSSWNDPDTYFRVCELIKGIPRDPARYDGAEKLNDSAGGIFYYYDKEKNHIEVPYKQMCEEYQQAQFNGEIPRRWDLVEFGKGACSYLRAMKQIRMCHLPKIKVHAKLRIKKNQERMEEIHKELFGSIPA